MQQLVVHLSDPPPPHHFPVKIMETLLPWWGGGKNVKYKPLCRDKKFIELLALISEIYVKNILDTVCENPILR